MIRGTGWIMENSWFRGKISLTAGQTGGSTIRHHKATKINETLFGMVLGALANRNQVIQKIPFWRRQYQGRRR